MKTILLTLIAAALVLAQDKKAGQPKLTPEQAAARLPDIPEGAKQVGPNLYRLTDKQGKAWMYRRTPFGIAKWEDKPTEQQDVVDDPVATTATDLGDSVRFERMTPFGPQKWVRKKTELTDEDKAVLAKQPQGKQPAVDSKAAPSKAQPSDKTPEKQ